MQYLFIIVLLALPLASAQGQNTFEKEIIFGTNTIGTALLQTPDGGYLVAGNKYGFDTVDLYYDYPCIFKFDADGNMQWMKFTSKSFPGEIHSLAASSDGNYFISGAISIDSSLKGFVMKFDPNGNTLWSKRIYYSSSVCCAPCPDGGCLIGYQSQAEEIMRIGPDGSLRWADSIYVGYANPYSIIPVGDSEYLVMSDMEFSFMKINLSGTVSWYKVLSGSTTSLGLAICKTSDGGFAVCGSVVLQNNTDIFVAKFDSSASLVWGRQLAEFSENNGLSLAEGNNGDLIAVCGGDPTGALILTMTHDGEVRSVKSFGGDTNFEMPAMIRSSDGGFVLTGGAGIVQSHKGGGLILAKLDSHANGCNLKDELYTVRPQDTQSTKSFTVNSGGILFPADITLTSNFPYHETDLCNRASVSEQREEAHFSLYPNPVRDYDLLTVSIDGSLPRGKYDLSVLDLLGTVVKKETITISGVKEDIYFDLSGFAAGVYIVELQSESDAKITYRAKLIKQN